MPAFLQHPLFKRYWPALAALLVVGGLVITFTDSDGDGKPDSVTITIGQANKQGQTKNIEVTADTDQQLDPAQVQEDKASAPEADETPSADAPADLDLHEDMKDETPPGVPVEVIEAGKDKTEEIADETLNEPKPPAGAQAYSCRPHYVVNQSALNGPRVGTALHFTVSNPGSINAIWRLFNTPSFGASSNYGMELTGECQEWVPKNRKAWAQGAANSAYFSIEIVTKDLTAEQWRNSPMIKRGILAALVRDLNRSVGAPLKLVDPNGCVWAPGIVDHDRLECGNTHWDVGNNFPWPLFIRQVRQGVCGNACELRKRNKRVHQALRDAKCKASGPPYRREICRKLDRRHRAIHAEAKRRSISL